MPCDQHAWSAAAGIACTAAGHCSPQLLCRLPPQGVGALHLPLSPAQADALVAVATPAPYGKGTATLLDQSVRRSLQLEPEQLSIANQEEWSGKLARAVKHAAEGLGLPPLDVKASGAAGVA